MGLNITKHYYIMTQVLSSTENCILCNNIHIKPIIFKNTCGCQTVVHPSCYNWHLRENNSKCPVCKTETVQSIGINEFNEQNTCLMSSSCCFIV